MRQKIAQTTFLGGGLGLLLNIVNLLKRNRFSVTIPLFHEITLFLVTGVYMQCMHNPELNMMEWPNDGTRL